MATLKSLVDETTNIKNELVECRNTLRQILIDKKIQGLENENSLKALISNINLLEDYDKDRVYLYNKGNQCINITGGWTKKINQLSSYWYGGQTLATIENGSIICATEKTRSTSSLAIQNKINLTDYKKIKIEFSIPNQSDSDSICYLYILNYLNEQTDWIGKSFKIDVSTSTTTYEYDISDISGSYYIGVIATTNKAGLTKLITNKIWLEK